MTNKPSRPNPLALVVGRANASASVMASPSIVALPYVQSAASRIVRLTPGTMPSGTAYDGCNGHVVSPSAIRSAAPS